MEREYWKKRLQTQIAREILKDYCEAGKKQYFREVELVSKIHITLGLYHNSYLKARFGCGFRQTDLQDLVTAF